MSAHEDGIRAAMYSLQAPIEFGTHRERAEDAIHAYLEASGQVLVPRQPSIEMSLAGGAVTVTHWENDRDYQDPIEAYAAEIVWEKMLDAYPQPFSQDKT